MLYVYGQTSQHLGQSCSEHPTLSLYKGNTLMFNQPYEEGIILIFVSQKKEVGMGNKA